MPQTSLLDRPVPTVTPAWARTMEDRVISTNGQVEGMEFGCPACPRGKVHVGGNQALCTECGWTQNEFIGWCSDLFMEITVPSGHEEVRIGSVILSEGASSLQLYMQRLRNGEIWTEKTPFRTLDRETNALRPGTITMLCGSPGAGKSFLVAQILMDFIKRGIKAYAFMLEGVKREHLERFFAMVAQEGKLLTEDFLKTAEAERLRVVHQDELDLIAKHFVAPALGSVSYEDMLKATEARLANGYKVIFIDPITVIEKKLAHTNNSWEADQRFMVRLGAMFAKYEAKCVLVTHPRDGSFRPGMSSDEILDKLAGGRAFGRFSMTALHLSRLKPAVDSQIEGLAGEQRHNRQLTILKARMGPGAGNKLALDFKPQYMQFAEVGLIEQG